MKKRTYIITDRRRRLVDGAMETAREMRARLDPELLARVRAAIGDAAAAVEVSRSGSFKPMATERVAVDQKKNLAIILKYLELNPGNKAVLQEVQSFLGRV